MTESEKENQTDTPSEEVEANVIDETSVKDEETLSLLDYYIPDSINDPMAYYKVNNQGVTILSDSEKINLYFMSSKV